MAHDRTRRLLLSLLCFWYVLLPVCNFLACVVFPFCIMLRCFWRLSVYILLICFVFLSSLCCRHLFFSCLLLLLYFCVFFFFLIFVYLVRFRCALRTPAEALCTLLVALRKKTAVYLSRSLAGLRCLGAGGLILGVGVGVIQVCLTAQKRYRPRYHQNTTTQTPPIAKTAAATKTLRELPLEPCPNVHLTRNTIIPAYGRAYGSLTT